MTISPTYPYNLQNGTTADATQVMADFLQIQNDVNANAAANGVNSDITQLTGLTTPLSVSQGGTGRATLGANGLLVGQGTSATTSVGAGTSGQVLTSNGAGSDPTFQGLSGVATGAIFFFPANAAPSGYLELDGSLKSRATYASLYTFAAASGNISANDGAWTAGQFSPGDGSTTFRIPDCRGYFLRGWADAGSVDSGRVIGSTQSSANLSHSHTASDSGHTHSQIIQSGAGGAVNPIAANTTSAATTSAAVATGTGNANVTVAASGGTEARPVNLAFICCIKT